MEESFNIFFNGNKGKTLKKFKKIRTDRGKNEAGAIFGKHHISI